MYEWLRRRIGVGAGNLLRVQKIFCPIFPNLPEKLYVTNFLPTNFLQLLVQSIFLYDLDIDLKIQNSVFEILF